MRSQSYFVSGVLKVKSFPPSFSSNPMIDASRMAGFTLPAPHEMNGSSIDGIKTLDSIHILVAFAANVWFSALGFRAVGFDQLVTVSTEKLGQVRSVDDVISCAGDNTVVCVRLRFDTEPCVDVHKIPMGIGEHKYTAFDHHKRYAVITNTLGMAKGNCDECGNENFRELKGDGYICIICGNVEYR